MRGLPILKLRFRRHICVERRALLKEFVSYTVGEDLLLRCKHTSTGHPTWCSRGSRELSSTETSITSLKAGITVIVGFAESRAGSQSPLIFLPPWYERKLTVIGVVLKAASTDEIFVFRFAIFFYYIR